MVMRSHDYIVFNLGDKKHPIKWINLKYLTFCYIYTIICLPKTFCLSRI